MQHKQQQAGAMPSMGGLPGALPLPGGMSGGGMLPGAVLPGMGESQGSQQGFNSSQPRTEAEQQALEENELLGSLSFSLSEQQAEVGRVPSNTQQMDLAQARAELSSQKMEAERVVAMANQQTQQLEAERAAAMAAAAEAMRQRKEAEAALAAQQAQLQ